MVGKLCVVRKSESLSTLLSVTNPGHYTINWLFFLCVCVCENMICLRFIPLTKSRLNFLLHYLMLACVHKYRMIRNPLFRDIAGGLYTWKNSAMWTFPICDVKNSFPVKTLELISNQKDRAATHPQCRDGSNITFSGEIKEVAHMLSTVLVVINILTYHFRNTYFIDEQLTTYLVLKLGLRHNLKDKGKKKHFFIQPIFNEHLLYAGVVRQTKSLSLKNLYSRTETDNVLYFRK